MTNQHLDKIFTSWLTFHKMFINLIFFCVNNSLPVIHLHSFLTWFIWYHLHSLMLGLDVFTIPSGKKIQFYI